MIFSKWETPFEWKKPWEESGSLEWPIPSPGSGKQWGKLEHLEKALDRNHIVPPQSLSTSHQETKLWWHGRKWRATAIHSNIRHCSYMTSTWAHSASKAPQSSVFLCVCGTSKGSWCSHSKTHCTLMYDNHRGREYQKRAGDSDLLRMRKGKHAHLLRTHGRVAQQSICARWHSGMSDCLSVCVCGCSPTCCRSLFS